MLKIGCYNGIDLLIPKNKLKEVAGRVAYFREFGNMYVFVGYGLVCVEKYVNCPIHPNYAKIQL